MNDLLFKSTEVLKWNDKFDYDISSNVNTARGAQLSMGASKVLSGKSNFSITLENLFSVGIVEILASSLVATVSNTSLALLRMREQCYSSIQITSAFSTETICLSIKVASTVALQSNISASYLTINKKISSSINVNSVCNVDTLIFGIEEVLSSTSRLKCKTTASLTMGYAPEVLRSIVQIVSTVATSKNKAKLNIDTVDIYNRRIAADLQCYYNHFSVNNRTLNLHQMPFPSVDKEFEKSVIELLFNGDYDKDSYRYMYRQVEDSYMWPESVRTRLMLDPETAKYYVADGDDPEIYNKNIYNIQSHDIIMLDRLLVYRLEPNNATLVGINYENLESTLSKMIYIYLELKLTGSYSKYNNDAIFANHVSVLETCYETYLTQNVFEHVSSKGT